ncbi:TetR family transcriptional regulator [Pseudomonas stutzeri]|nr:TetR family transcriptional regulator [Stutzerimonas stutzeri]
MVRRTKEEAEATRQQILDSAERVFAAKGVAHSTMADIAAAAGVSRGAVYWHFTSKIDVFNAMISRQRDANRVVCAAARNPEESDPLGQIRSILVHFLHKVVHDPQQRRVSEIFHHKCELAGELEGLRQHLQDTGNEIDDDIATSLANAVRRGQLPAELDIPRAVICLHGYIDGLIGNWLLRPTSYALDREAAALVDALLFMLQHSPTLRRPAP